MRDGSRGPAPILFVHYGHDWIRGSERCLLDLLEHLDRDRFRPILWCNGQTLAGEARKLDVPVVVDRFSILLGYDAPRVDLTHYARLLSRAGRLIREHDVRILHANGVAPTQWLFPVARRLALPLLTHVHAPYNTRDRITLGLHHTSLAVGVTQGCLDDLLTDGFPPERTVTIHNGVDFSTWEAWDERGLRGRLGIAPDDVIITQVGSLIHRKGHDILLRALAELRGDHPRCRLIIVGDGPDRAGIEALVEELGLRDVVHFLGFTPCPPGVVFRDATDIAVSPSRMEGFGLTVVEAGAAGCPVVATATTGMTEILDDGHTGFIVPVEDQEKLTAAIRRLVESPELREHTGAALQRSVLAHFTIARYVDDFHATYERLLRVPRSELGWRGGRWKGRSGLYMRWVARVVSARLSRSRTRLTK